MTRLFILLSFVFVISLSFSQNQSCPGEIDSLLFAVKIDSLHNIYGNNKEIPARFELPALIALSRFPELKNTKIIFKSKKIKTTLNTRPTFWSLVFCKKKNRKYIIRVNNSKKDSLVLFDPVPFNAKIGLLGHEFSHIVDYNGKKSGGVFGRGWEYRNKAKKEQFEKEIDSITISRGLGWQLYDWSDYVLNKSNATKKYKVYKKEIYLKPEEIIRLIQSLSFE